MCLIESAMRKNIIRVWPINREIVIKKDKIKNDSHATKTLWSQSGMITIWLLGQNLKLVIFYSTLPYLLDPADNGAEEVGVEVGTDTLYNGDKPFQSQTWNR